MGSKRRALLLALCLHHGAIQAMGDRNNPIKFGPEWLRNLARERHAASSGPNGQNAGAVAGGGGGAAGGGGGGGGHGHNQPVPGPSGGTAAPNYTSPNPRNNTQNTQNAQNAPKVQLAKLRQNNPNHVRQARETQRYYATRHTRQDLGRRWRYGREEMLALYDRNTEAPNELRGIDLLYQPRSKPPTALATFEEETRDNVRNVPPPNSAPHGERFGVGRGLGRGLGPTEGRGGRARGSYIRQQTLNRNANWNAGAPRMPMYSGGPDDDSGATLRSWNNSSNLSINNRNPGEQAEWQPNKTFRRRPGAHTNWRQASRDEGDEWRADTARSSRHQDRWGERDWGDRPVHHPSWNTNRRTWVGGDGQNNEENLPEWAVENAEACGGTFDSSGAFHGYSNDDSNLPKPQDSAYALTRSHTHGNVVRQKTAEEGSEEWWASEKAKKLSPKRFDAGDIKFKKTSATSSAEAGPSTSTNKEVDSKDDLQEIPEKLVPNDEHSESATGGDVDKYNKEIQQTNFLESKTFDALMRPNINMNESGDERSNFQSVMIAPNNSLRQKHQNMGPPIIDPHNKQSHMSGMLRMVGVPLGDIMPDQSRNSLEDKLVEQMFDMALEDKDMLPKMQTPTNNHMMNQPHPSSSGMSAAMTPNIYSRAPPMLNQMPMGMGGNMHGGHGMPMHHNNRHMMPAPGMQPIGITNSALNASLGLPLGGPNMGMGLQGVPPPILPNAGMHNPGLGNNSMQGNMSSAMQAAAAAFQSNPGMAAMSAASVGNNSLFMRPNTNNAPQMQQNEMPMPNHGGPPNMYPMHGLQHQGPQGGFGNLMYGNMMQPAAQPPSPAHNLADQWYYEDPKNIIQGPFLSKEMFHWYTAGFFTSDLLVRRACDSMMRSLSSYGPIVPFAQLDVMPFPMPNNNHSHNHNHNHENMLHSPQSLALDIMNMPNLNMPPDNASLDGLQFGSVGMRNPPFGQNQMGDSMWGQSSSSTDMIWMQQGVNPRNENRPNHPMFFWDRQPSASTSNSLLPEGMPKEMKTEDQILAQLRATQNIGPPPSMSFFPDPPPLPVPTPRPDDMLTSNATATPNLQELHKLIQQDSLVVSTLISESSETSDKIKPEKSAKIEMNSEANAAKQQAVAAKAAESKPAKQAKSDADKTPKIKETNNAKNKNKKPKEDKKDEAVEAKAKEKEEVNVEKRSSENSPSKGKKEDKANKKEIEKEKKEWIKDGFTVVKGSEKNFKDSKKKIEEAKATEEAERKKKEDDKLADEEKKKKQAEALRKIHEQNQQQQQRQANEYIMKKAPWSASAQAMQATNKDGLTLAEIQRLEREKKLEQMKEQQHMMQILAHQQAVSIARDQEVQAGQGWAKKKAGNSSSSGQSMAEIQAEARRQAVDSTTGVTQAMLDFLDPLPSVPTTVPWGSPQNGGGFWDAPQLPSPPKSEKPQEVPKIPEVIKIKKKPAPIPIPVKKEPSPAAEFEDWCTLVLSSWSSKIDVPTFIGFLKDIESPYEVKDYVKCYLGETKESADFARQFLEKRSKLLRVGMATPSDDLCSPAMAINPRPAPSTEYQEVKGKGKKTKKNKMLKVDARILGFSVTAAEDRINVGDIDTA